MIPTNWIIRNEAKIQFCPWPPEEVNSDVIRKADVPDPTWKLHRIKIYGGNKTFGNNKQYNNIIYNFNFYNTQKVFKSVYLGIISIFKLILITFFY